MAIEDTWWLLIVAYAAEAAHRVAGCYADDDDDDYDYDAEAGLQVLARPIALIDCTKRSNRATFHLVD